MNDRSNLFARIYHLKPIIVGLAFVLLGILTSLFADWLSSNLGTSHLILAILSSLSDVFLVTGAIGIAVDFFTGRDKEAADTERTRTVLKELTPDFTDAVLKGLAVNKDDLKRVANPELLDDIASNVMSLRLGDEQFARELYAEIRDQAIRAPERWYDVEVNVRLSTAVERSTSGTPLFDVTVEWQYTTVPSHAVRRFACVSDRDEFNELVGEVPVTSTWFMRDRPGMDATSRDCYELLSFSVDGEERPIRRSGRKTGQTYTASIGNDVVAAGTPVRIRHVYRTVTSQAGHRLFFELPQPTRDLSLRLDYSDTDISHLSVTDLLSSTRHAEISRLPAEVAGKVVAVDVPGWLMPKAGLAFVWTLRSEDPADAATHVRAA